MLASIHAGQDRRAERGDGMSIIEIRGFLVAEGERRRRLGLLALNRQPGDWDLSFNPPKFSEDEPKALEDD
jgi:hypothetical protein